MAGWQYANGAGGSQRVCNMWSDCPLVDRQVDTIYRYKGHPSTPDLKAPFHPSIVVINTFKPLRHYTPILTSQPFPMAMILDPGWPSRSQKNNNGAFLF